MSARPFDQLPDDARVWIFASTRPLQAAEAERILDEVDRFVDGWLAHGAPVVGGRDLRHGRFLLIAADERATGVSGCSIDSLYRTLQQLERELNIVLLDSAPVWFRTPDGEIDSLPRPAFRERARAGEADGDTVVFDNTVRTLGQVRHGEWERPAREAWQAALLSA